MTLGVKSQLYRRYFIILLNINGCIIQEKWRLNDSYPLQ